LILSCHILVLAIGCGTTRGGAAAAMEAKLVGFEIVGLVFGGSLTTGFGVGR
jgi:hypothetical protein